MKRAFTLIELLVVISIIAILAAILFPAFAQAKESAKKIVDLSNMKQIATSTMLYLSDWDDMFPLGTTSAANDPSGWSWGQWHEIPSDWDPSIGPAYIGRNQGMWANSIQPYVKSWEIYEGKGAPRVLPSFSNISSQPDRVKAGSTYTFNGLLQAYSSTGTAAPSNCILFWSGKGKRVTEGYATTNPYLICNDPNAPCVYNPGNAGCSNANNGFTSDLERTIAGGTRVTAWTYLQGQNFVATDTSAKFRRIGSQVDPVQTDYRTDPWATYVEGGRPEKVWYLNSGGSSCHPYMFRPDYDFTGREPAVAL